MPGPPQPRDLPRRRWLALCTIGESAGIAVVALAYAASERGVLGPAGILAAGAGEGLFLGTAQALVLGAYGVPTWRWIVATVVVAVLGYAGSLAAGAGGAGAGVATPAIPLLVAGGAGLGLVMGVIMGAAQAVASDGRLPFRAWSLANALGWAAGMALIMVAAAMAPGAWTLAGIAALGAASGAGAGLCVGLATWPVLAHAADTLAEGK